MFSLRVFCSGDTLVVSTAAGTIGTGDVLGTGSVGLSRPLSKVLLVITYNQDLIILLILIAYRYND